MYFFNKNNMISSKYNLIVMTMILFIIFDETKYAVSADECRENITKLGFNGKFIHDFMYCTDEYEDELYVIYLGYIRKNKTGRLPPHEIDLISTFCNVTTFLKSQEFTGKYEDDIEKLKTYMIKIEEEKKNGSYENKSQIYDKIVNYGELLNMFEVTLKKFTNLLKLSEPNESLKTQGSMDEYKQQLKMHQEYSQKRENLIANHKTINNNYVIWQAARTWLAKAYNYIAAALTPSESCRATLKNVGFHGHVLEDGQTSKNNNQSEDGIPKKYEECSKKMYEKIKLLSEIEATEEINFNDIYCFHSNLLLLHGFDGSLAHDKQFTPEYTDLNVEIDSYRAFLAQVTSENGNFLCEYAIDIFLKRLEADAIEKKVRTNCKNILNELEFKGLYDQDKDKSITDNQNSYGLAEKYSLFIKYIREKNIEKPENYIIDTYEFFCEGANILDSYGYEGIHWYDTCYSPETKYAYARTLYVDELNENDREKTIKNIKNDSRLNELIDVYKPYLQETKEEPNLVYRFFVQILLNTLSSNDDEETTD